MSEILTKITDLSPEKRKLLELMLQEEGVDISRSVIVPQSRDTNRFPLSFSQQRLWFLDQLEPGSPMYNIPSAVRLAGRLDLTVLRRCIHEIFRRHEALRTTFVSENGKPLQVIAPELTPELPVIDLRHLPETERETEALRLAREEARRPFDLTQGPLLRVTLVRLKEDEYIALLTMHHIISDGWSMGVLIGEIGALYAAFAAGEPSPLPELPVQYADFGHWQRRWLQGEVLASQLDYWKRQLDDLAVLELPTDRPRPAFQSTRGGTLSSMLPRRLAEELKAVGQQERATLFMTLLAGFQALLCRYTGQEGFGVGSPIANRNRAEIEGLIGFFVNTLVLRADLSGDPTFRQLLARVREVTLGAYAHQDLPFEMLVEELQPERDMSHTPLFQVMFILQNAPGKARRLPDLTLSRVDVHSATSTFDLTLSMSESDRGLSMSFEYNTDLFEERTIERLAGHFERLLAGVVADPDQRVSRLPLMTAAEERRLLVEWNDTAADYPAELCLHQLFEAQVARRPGAEAARCAGESLSYEELNRRANQVAHHLRRLGVGPEILVGLSVGRSLDMVVGLLGILKAGGAYLPLDPDYPAERLTYMLSDAQVRVVVTQAELAEHLPTRELRVVCLDEAGATIAEESEENPESGVGVENAAYVIYTSGSTGRPKGVVVPHGAVVNHNVAMAKAFDLTPEDRVLQFATINFDAALEELFPTWWVGATVVLRSEALLTAGEDLLELVEREGLTVLDLPTAYWHEWVYELTLTGAQLPPSLRLVILGGEKAQAERVAAWDETAGVAWINSYGPTEGTIVATVYRPEPEAGLWDARREVPIGRPIANDRVYVLDRQLQPVPVGVPGELHIGGVGVTRGYLGRPELTAERFIPDPYSEERGARLYKTGDLARYLPDGNIEFLGRVDHQVKVRGFRVEPGEIEAVLGGHPDLRESVVVARDGEGGSSRLVAYLVAAGETAPELGELREYLRDKLPEYMVPSVFVTLAALPLTPSGKVDRRALPEPEWTREELAVEYVAPRTPEEELLVGIWTQVLGVDRVGVHDNFFQLGGHSLLATQVISRLRTAFQIELPVRDLFEAPTVAGLARRIDVLRQEAQGLSAPPIEPVPRDGALPLSYAQQRLWFLDQLEPDSPLYNIPDAVRITGELDLTALERGLNEIVRRHEVLRTTFHTINGKPSQRIASEMVIPVKYVDLSELPTAERETEAERLMVEEAQRPFNLARGPLVRATVMQLGPGDHLALLTMHHIVSDGWSGGVLTMEMAVLYDALSNGRPSPLPELEIQYADFAHWQREWLQGEVLERQISYWKEQLAGAPPLLELPTDRPRPPVQTIAGAHYPFELPAGLAQKLKDLSQREGTTLFMTLLAAFQTLLYRYSGQEDVVVGTPIAGRNRDDIEGLIGFFVNTLALRADLSGEPGFLELLKQVRETALGAYAHQDLPFEMLVDELQPQRNLSHSPLFQVMFMWQNAPLQGQSIPGLTFQPLVPESGMAKFDLTLALAEQEDALGGVLEYNTDLFDAATIERIVDHFQMLLAGIVAEPDRAVSELPLLTAAEKQRLLVEWNDTAAPYPQERCAHHLFEAQVERAPDALAVTFEEESMTYAELNRRANQLAHYLRKRGVGSETLVGICAERSLEVVVGLLGVLKAGGAYLPIDPTYPQERISFMLEDARMPILLTQAHLVDRLPTYPANEQTNRQTAQPTIIPLDADWATVARESEENPQSDATPDSLAYVIYTSGSTGRPKGAMIVHRGLVNYLTWCQRAYPVAEGQGAPVHSSISFDLTVTGLFAPLVAGRRVQMLAEDVGIEPLSAALRQEADYSLVKITPAHLELLSQQLAPGEVAGRTRAFIIGGENLLAEHIAFWQEAAPDTLLVNEYGPTETVVGCCVYQVPPGERPAGSVPIGRPIINTQLYILDRQMRPVPIGVVGELYIGGAGVARGYLRRAELTAERFVPDPYQGESGARMYKTGDLARYMPDGNIKFLGRVDHQVKVRGFRVELGEIEAVLSQHPVVGETVVLAREDTPGARRLVAYVVPQDGAEPQVGGLRGFLGEKLPEYMVPSAFVTLEALPLTSNGKVDRRALPAPDGSRPELEAAYVEPRTGREELLADIWIEVLGVEQVGVHDNFFELGGDSILGIQVISQANQAGLQLTPKLLFQHPTVAGLAAMAGTGPAIQAEQGVVEGPVPLTPIQHWFFEQDLPERSHYNQSLLLAVHQELDPALLETAVRHLVAHHDALRLRFQPSETGWRQVNAGVEGELPFEWLDLSGLLEAKRRAALEGRAAALQASLDLAAGPLLRVAYFDLGVERPGRLLMVVHHLAIDGVSWRILLEDLQTAYEQLAQGQPVRFPPKTTSFRRWAERLVAYAQSEALREEVPHWLDVAQGWVPTLSVDYPDGANTEASARTVTVSLDKRETQTLLQEVPTAYRTEINDVLLTALAQAMGSRSTGWTDSPALLVDLEGHGREDILDGVDLSRTVGWFTTIYPVLLDLTGADGPGQAIKAVKEQLRRVPQRGIGYGLLRYLCEDRAVDGRLRALPQAQMSFNYLGQFDQALPKASPFGAARESKGLDRSPKGERSHVLEINGGVAGGRLGLEWTYSRNLHRRSTIERLAEDFMVALRELIAHCQSPDAGGVTPSDFGLASLDQKKLDKVLTSLSKSKD